MTRSPSDARLAELIQQVTAVLDQLKSLDARHAHAVGDLEARLSAWTALETDLRARTRALEDLSDAAARSADRIRRAETQLNSLVPTSVAEDLPAAADASGLAVSSHVRRASRSYDALTQVLTERIESLELAALVERQEWQQAFSRFEQPHHLRYLALGGLAVAWLASLGIALGWTRGFDARLRDAVGTLAAAERQAASIGPLAQQRIATTQQEMGEQVARAAQAARRVQFVNEVLAAPDLVRVHLPGGARAPRAEMQLLWSPTRGSVLSGSGVPMPPVGRQHHLWLLTTGRPMSVGSFGPDPQGLTLWLTERTQPVSAPVTGAAVTSELATALPLSSEASLRARALAVSDPPDPVSHSSTLSR